ncbi:MAG: hydroxymethylglutaryl-CoA synthase family protein [Candidatus Micrarchaeota archaeon]|nr:hydroxymethylglutaryl-CoA synthase family protein [Candidatus Micrarchaeota archaeon]
MATESSQVDNASSTGISYIGLESTPYLVTAKTISEHLNLPVDQIRKGLGINMFRFPGFSDTHITIGANNILRFAENIMTQEPLKKHFIDYGIGAVYVATESSGEQSRPATQAMLEIVEPVLIQKYKNRSNEERLLVKEFIKATRSSDTMEMKFACTALTKSVNLASNYIMNQGIEGAIVIGSDIAIYDHKKAQNAEATQGAGSALVYLTKDPLLIKLNNKSAHYNLPTYDFHKPDEHTPIVSSGFGSKVNYVVTLGSAFESYEKQFGINKDSYLVSHVPYPIEAEYNGSMIYVHELRKNNPAKLRRLEEKIGMAEPIGDHTGSLEFLRSVVKSHYSASIKSHEALMDFLNNHQGVKNLWAFHKKVRATSEFAAFKDSIGLNHSLKIPSNVGNSYNCSLWFKTGSLARAIIKEQILPKPIIFGSYGSGSGATIFEGEFVKSMDRKEQIKLVDIKSLGRGIFLTLDEYRAIHDAKIERNEYCEGNNNLMRKDWELLRNKSSAAGFKLICYNSRREGEYAYNGTKVSHGPVIIDVRM